jgi:hypothetical protein
VYACTQDAPGEKTKEMPRPKDFSFSLKTEMEHGFHPQITQIYAD